MAQSWVKILDESGNVKLSVDENGIATTNQFNIDTNNNGISIDGIDLSVKLDEKLDKSGGTMNGNILFTDSTGIGVLGGAGIYPYSGNEINFISSANNIYFGYRKSQGIGTVSEYHFGNSNLSGNGGTIFCSDVVVSGKSTLSEINSIDSRISDAVGNIQPYFSPDYSNPIDIKSDLTSGDYTYTAPGYGIIVLNIDDNNQNSGEIYVIVNENVKFACEASGGYASNTLVIPVKTGDTIRKTRYESSAINTFSFIPYL